MLWSLLTAQLLKVILYVRLVNYLIHVLARKSGRSPGYCHIKSVWRRERFYANCPPSTTQKLDRADKSIYLRSFFVNFHRNGNRIRSLSRPGARARGRH